MSEVVGQQAGGDQPDATEHEDHRGNLEHDADATIDAEEQVEIFDGIDDWREVCGNDPVEQKAERRRKGDEVTECAAGNEQRRSGKNDEYAVMRMRRILLRDHFRLHYFLDGLPVLHADVVHLRRGSSVNDSFDGVVFEVDPGVVVAGISRFHLSRRN